MISEFDAQILQVWWVFCTTLVILMIVGFTLLESGWVHKKHIGGIAVKNVIMFLVPTTAYG